jgi:hypothetical protein
VARARAGDERVGDFLAALPRDTEPNLRIGVLNALEHARKPSRAVHAWREQLIERETNRSVLQQVLSPWRIARALNRRTAPNYAAAIDRRLQRGDLDTAMRGRALQALAHAGIYTPQAAAALARAAINDSDEKLRNFARDAGQIVRSGEANGDAIQKAWQKQYPPPAASSMTSITMVTGTVDLNERKKELDEAAKAAATGEK